MDSYKKFARKFYLYLDKAPVDVNYYIIKEEEIKNIIKECNFKEFAFGEEYELFKDKFLKVMEDVIKDEYYDRKSLDVLCLASLLKSVFINFTSYQIKLFSSLCDESIEKEIIINTIYTIEQFVNTKFESILNSYIEESSNNLLFKILLDDIKVKSLESNKKELEIHYSIDCKVGENTLNKKFIATKELKTNDIIVKDDKLRMLNKAIKLINTKIEALKVKRTDIDRSIDILSKLSKVTTNDLYSISLLDNLVRMLKEYRKIMIELDDKESNFESVLSMILESTKLIIDIDMNYIHIEAPYDKRTIEVTIEGESNDLNFKGE